MKEIDNIELVNGEVAPGDHAVRFDGTNLASGIYFCRLITAGHILTREMCLIR